MIQKRPRKGAKAVAWDWEVMQTVFSDNKACYELTGKQVALFLAVTRQARWSTRWFNPPEDFQDVLSFVNEAQMALTSPVECGNEPPAPPAQEVIREYICLVDDREEELEEIMSLRIVKTAQGTYLQDDCGCGEVAYYSLTPVSVNPTTGAVGTSIDVIPDDTLNIPADNPTECYYGAAGNVILGALTDYMNGLAGYYQTGALSALLGAGIEAQQLVAAILSGNVDLNVSNLGLTTQEVIEAFTASGYIAWLEEKLEERGLNGQLTRWNIARLTQFEVPQQFNIPTPITPFLNYWGLFANLKTLNDNLALASAQCTGGVNPVVSQCWTMDFTKFATLESTGLVIRQVGADLYGSFVPGVGFVSAVESTIGQDVLDVGFEPSVWNPAVTITHVGVDATAPLPSGTFLRASTGAEDGSFTNVQGQQNPYVASTGTVSGMGINRYGVFLNGDSGQFTITSMTIQFGSAVSAANQMMAINCP